MRILLTGSDGFIGRNVHSELMNREEVDSVTCIEKDYMNHNKWEKSLQYAVEECDSIIHIGAISDTMLQDPNEMMKYNFEFSRVLFDLADICGKKVIYASSAANKGDGGQTPSNLYGWSKYITEKYGLAKLKTTDVEFEADFHSPFIALRYFNVYGPGEQNKGKMASVAFQAFRLGKFELFPGTPRRDFVYIKDVVSATIHPLFNKIASGIYEVGSGDDRTFEDVLQIMGVKFTYKSELDVPKGYQYNTRANKNQFMVGWERIYNLERGLKEYKEYLES